MKKRKDEEEFDFFDIDKDMLDREWVNQPKLFYNYASQLADARREVEEARAGLDIIRAEVDKSIRDDPKEYDLPDKITETLISNTIIQQSEYEKALTVLRDAKYNVDILQAAVSALDHRKSALERLVSLHGQNYFATPKAPDEMSRRAVEDIEKDAARKHKKKGKHS